MTYTLIWNRTFSKLKTHRSSQLSVYIDGIKYSFAFSWYDRAEFVNLQREIFQYRVRKKKEELRLSLPLVNHPESTELLVVILILWKNMN